MTSKSIIKKRKTMSGVCPGKGNRDSDSEEDEFPSRVAFIWNMRLLLQNCHPSSPALGGWNFELLEKSLEEDYLKYFGKLIKPKGFKRGAKTWQEVFESDWFKPFFKIRKRKTVHQSFLVDESPRAEEDFEKIAYMASYESCRVSDDPVLKILLKLPISKETDLEDKVAERVNQIQNFDISKIASSPVKNKAKLYSQVIKKCACNCKSSDSNSNEDSSDSEPTLKKILPRSNNNDTTLTKAALAKSRILRMDTIKKKVARISSDSDSNEELSNGNEKASGTTLDNSVMGEPVVKKLLGPATVSYTTENNPPKEAKDQSCQTATCEQVVPFDYEEQEQRNEKQDCEGSKGLMKCLDKGTDNPCFDTCPTQKKQAENSANVSENAIFRKHENIGLQVDLPLSMHNSTTRRDFPVNTSLVLDDQPSNQEKVVMKDATTSMCEPQLQIRCHPERHPLPEYEREHCFGSCRSSLMEDTLPARLGLYNTPRPRDACAKLTMAITCLYRHAELLADDLHDIFSQYGHVRKAMVIASLTNDLDYTGFIELSSFRTASHIVELFSKKCIVLEKNGQPVFSFHLKSTIVENQELSILEPGTKMAVNYDLHPRIPNTNKFNMFVSMN